MNILQINTSLFSDHGVSSRLSDRLVARLVAADPATTVVKRDLGREPLPHLGSDTLAALSTAPEARTPEQAASVAAADAAIAELVAADVLVVAAPMYNFAVPTQLKAWFDRVARAGTTFRYTAEGPQGLLTGKKAVVVTTRGGIHRDRPTDGVTPWVRTMLGFLGITDVEVIYAEGLALGDAPRGAAIARAEAEVDALAATARRAA
jgi:FMN-dependent NADH-azoreductase